MKKKKLKKLTYAQFVCAFEKVTRANYKTVDYAAKAYGVSRRQLYNVFDATAKPNDAMLDEMNMDRKERAIETYTERS